MFATMPGRTDIPVAIGPVRAEEAAGIARFGDLTSYAPAIQKLAAS
jgi:hypothetical protein